MGPLMINMAFMLLYMWEMWDVTPVTHEHTDEQWKVVQYSVWTESAIRSAKTNEWCLFEIDWWHQLMAKNCAVFWFKMQSEQWVDSNKFNLSNIFWMCQLCPAIHLQNVPSVEQSGKFLQKRERTNAVHCNCMPMKTERGQGRHFLRVSTKSVQPCCGPL